MLFDPGKGISFEDKNHPSRGINFIFKFRLIRQGAFGALFLFSFQFFTRLAEGVRRFW
jgi:hypothetical protein